MNDLILVREYKSTATLGKIFYNNQLICHTIELPWKNNSSYISCIPEGDYRLQKRHSNRFKKVLYEVQKVPNRTGILIHSGNSTEDLKGCIAPCEEIRTNYNHFTGILYDYYGMQSKRALLNLTNLLHTMQQDNIKLIIR